MKKISQTEKTKVLTLRHIDLQSTHLQSFESTRYIKDKILEEGKKEADIRRKLEKERERKRQSERESKRDKEKEVRTSDRESNGTQK